MAKEQCRALGLELAMHSATTKNWPSLKRNRFRRRMRASEIEQKSRCKRAQSAKLSWSPPGKTGFIGRSWKDCKSWKSILDYVENLRLGDYGVTGGHGATGQWHMTLLETKLLR
jgi:hypothetical protein